MCNRLRGSIILLKCLDSIARQTKLLPNTNRSPTYLLRTFSISSPLSRRIKKFERHLYVCGSLVDVMDEQEVTEDFSPPSEVARMTELNRDAFVKTVYVPAVVLPQAALNKARKKLWKFVLRIPSMVPIREFSSEEKMVLLDRKFVKNVNDCNSQVEEFVNEIVDFKKAFRIVELHLTYDNWNAEDIFKAILPPGESISGFSIVGHLVHFNLRPHHEPYKKLIGEVILDKLKNIRTAVNKTDTIDNVYRFFKMEILAGDDDTIVTVKENGCSFQFDFAKVYWNSRLSTEHERIVNSLQPGDLLYDVFAGVGPFALPCARKGVQVLANDLNPESYKWLKSNVESNTSRKYPCNKNIQIFNRDGRDFIKEVIAHDLVKRESFSKKIHIVMNLPALAVEFLDAFVGLLDTIPDSVPEAEVHCYTFSKAEGDDHDFKADAKLKAEKVLRSKLPSGHVIRVVRNVAPNKEMLCLNFRLTKEILTRKCEPDAKRMKLDEAS